MARQTVSDTMKFRLVDSGDSIEISGAEREEVEAAVRQLAHCGAYVGRALRHDGEKWTASCHRFDPPDDTIQIEWVGSHLFIRSRSIECVRVKVAGLAQAGLTQEGAILRIGAFYSAVLFDPSGHFEP
jgi:hypothetical protein